MALDVSAAQAVAGPLANDSRSISVTIDVVDKQIGEDAREFSAKIILKGTIKKIDHGWIFDFNSQNIQNSGTPKVDDSMMLYSGPIKIRTDNKFRPITIDDWPSIYPQTIGESGSTGDTDGKALGLDDPTYAVRLFFQPLFYLSLPEMLSLSEGEDLSSLVTFSPETASTDRMKVTAIDRQKNEASVEWSEVTDDVAMRDTLMNRVEKIEKAKNANVSRVKMKTGLDSLVISQNFGCNYIMDISSEMAKSANCYSFLSISNRAGKSTVRDLQYRIDQRLN